jgi:hypothetical protein
MTRRGQRGTALVIGGVLALLFSAIAAVQVAGWTVGAVERSTTQKITGTVDQLVVDADGGEITVVPSINGVVTISSTVKGSIHTPQPHVVRDGNTVRLDGRCPDISFGPCRARITIFVPRSTPVEIDSGSGDLSAIGLTGRVELHTGSGDVDATGLTGAATLQTGSGDVNVRGLSGPTELHTGSGDVTAEDLGTRDLVADTSSGDVGLEFRLAPDSVTADTASGDVDIALPRSGAPYRFVEPDPGSGEQHVNVASDPDSARIVRAQTSSGDVTVSYGN